MAHFGNAFVFPFFLDSYQRRSSTAFAGSKHFVMTQVAFVPISTVEKLVPRKCRSKFQTRAIFLKNPSFLCFLFTRLYEYSHPWLFGASSSLFRVQTLEPTPCLLLHGSCVCLGLSSKKGLD